MQEGGPSGLPTEGPAPHICQLVGHQWRRYHANSRSFGTHQCQDDSDLCTSVPQAKREGRDGCIFVDVECGYAQFSYPQFQGCCRTGGNSKPCRGLQKLTAIV